MLLLLVGLVPDTERRAMVAVGVPDIEDELVVVSETLGWALGDKAVTGHIVFFSCELCSCAHAVCVCFRVVCVCVVFVLFVLCWS